MAPLENNLNFKTPQQLSLHVGVFDYLSRRISILSKVARAR